MAKSKKTNSKKGSYKKENSIKKTVVETGKKTLLIVGGIVAGKALSSVVTKTLKKTDPAKKLDGFAGFEASGLITPVLLIAGGIAGNHFAKNENLKLISTGVAAAGAIDTVSVLIKKDVLTAFGNVNETPIQIAPYKPDLPKVDNIAYLPKVIERGRIEDYPDYQELSNMTSFDDIN